MNINEIPPETEEDLEQVRALLSEVVSDPDLMLIRGRIAILCQRYPVSDHREKWTALRKARILLDLLNPCDACFELRSTQAPELVPGLVINNASVVAPSGCLEYAAPPVGDCGVKRD